ncbi:MAG: tripartite tricarboxylate transporter substrate binding protein [Burkholderiales bacterium]
MLLARSILAAAVLMLSCAAQAQVYPAKPVRLIVPYPAGGGTDFFARVVGAQLAIQFGQPVVVENKPGAATIVGAEAAAKSPADGYTLLLGDTATFAVNPSLYKKLPYDPSKDLTPVTMTGRFALLLVVNPAKLKVRSVYDLVETAKQASGRIDYASPGPGSPHHLAMEMFRQRTGVEFTHVPYKGAAPAVQDLLAGQVSLMFLDLAAGAPQIKAGKLRALAVASDKRIAALPDLPTIAESGPKDFEAWAWQMLAVPENTPRDIVNRINAEYRKAIAMPELRQKLIDAGIDPLQSSPQDASAYIRSEALKWAKVISEGRIRVE